MVNRNTNSGRNSSKLYHTELGLPSSMVLPDGRYRLSYSQHARRAAQEDKYGNISHFLALHLSLDTKSAKLIEVETYDDVWASKLVYRLPLAPGDKRDLILVVIPGSGTWTVKTVWINLANDKHKTLNANHYCVPTSPRK